jgi:alanyl-tRNA synthetase
MEQAKERSRQGSNISGDIFVESIFTQAPETSNSDKDTENISIAFMVKDDQIVDKVKEGDRLAIITSIECSSFYKEAGGQAGDSGIIKDEKSCIQITNTILAENKIVHICVVEKGEVILGQKMIIERDCQRNKTIACNHTATHMLQSALKEVLGEHIKQSGSAVDEARLRFDFTHTKKMTQEQLEKVEQLVNDKIEQSICVNKKVMDKEQAREEGAIALFGEKYGEKVRVVSIGDCSKEFCGGSHVDNTKDIGLFKIISEGSIASGIRRIEAITGEDVIKKMRQDIEGISLELSNSSKSIKDINEQLKVEIAKLATDVESFQKKDDKETSFVDVAELYYQIYPKYEKINAALLKQQKKLAKLEKKSTLKDLDQYVTNVLENAPMNVDGMELFCVKIDNCDMNVLRNVSDFIRSQNTNRIFTMLSEKEGKVSMIVTYTGDLKNKGLNASNIVKELSPLIQGSGGGRVDFAQAGGSDPAGIEKVLATAKDVILKSLK